MVCACRAVALRPSRTICRQRWSASASPGGSSDGARSFPHVSSLGCGHRPPTRVSWSRNAWPTHSPSRSRASGSFAAAKADEPVDLEPDGEFHVTRNAVAHLLAERGWTDAALAAGAGLDRAHVNQVKNGRALPTVATALAIARALGVSVAVAFPRGSSTFRRPRRRGGGRPAVTARS